MRIFADYHHDGLARGVCKLFRDRLGHAVFFPSRSWCEQVSGDNQDRVWTFRSEDQEVWYRCQGLPPTIDRDKFLSNEWDMVLITRTESQPIFKQILTEHKLGDKIKRVVISGNQGGGFDWSSVHGMLTSDLATYHHSPLPVEKKLHYSQEITVSTPAFVPVLADNLKRVHCYQNFLHNYRDRFVWDGDISQWSGCPHCTNTEGPQELAIYSPARDLWRECQDRLLLHTFHSYGRNCDEGFIEPCFLPLKYTEGAISWHFKHVEGYGFSLLQSIACGRLVIVQDNFYRYRTAGRYLIPNLTCFEVPWNAEAICDVIRWFTDSLERVNEYSEACWKAGKSLFAWEHEAYRVNEWLKGI